MALTKTTVDVTNISDLSSTPNATEGLTAAQLQAKFDKTGSDLKTYINDTLTEEIDTYHGDVTQTELSYVHGVTSAIQTQLDDKKINTIVGTSVATNEYVGGKRVYKKRVSIGNLPNNTSANTAHGLTMANITVMRFEGVARASTTVLGLPYNSSTTANIISIYLDATNIVVSTGNDKSAYTGYVDIYYYTN